jgi:hypothetical protein
MEKNGRHRRVPQRADRRLRLPSERSEQSKLRIPIGAIAADPAQLVHDGTYGPRPTHYAARPFTCVDCGKQQIWTAEQQKWWYQTAKGKIASAANRCRVCRQKRRHLREGATRAMMEGLIAKYGLEAAAKRLKLEIGALVGKLNEWADADRERERRQRKMKPKTIARPRP